MSDWKDFYERFVRGRFPRGFFKDFDEFDRELGRISEEMFRDMEQHAPKDMIRERKLPSGGISRELGPFVYGYSMTVGPDGKLEIREFGNVKPSKGKLPIEFAETREPLVDIIDQGDSVKVVAEMAGVNKSDISLELTEKTLVISSSVSRKYHKEVGFDVDILPDSATAKYNNGILEVQISKSRPSRAKGTQIKVG